MIRNPELDLSEASCLVSRIDNRGLLVEGMTADNELAFINNLYAVLVRPIIVHGGQIDQYISGEGGLVAVFKDLEPETHKQGALDAALQIHKSMTSWNELLQRQGKVQFNFRIGIASGEVLSTNIGTEDRMQYCTLGPAVNEARHLAEFASDIGFRILLGESSTEDVEIPEGIHKSNMMVTLKDVYFYALIYTGDEDSSKYLEKV